eukprot:TRINITY_DN17265_c1_g3_i1.p1 TRINITY_DN17265_c1_g3~~TRINITY_DN17265_c1_g3_i1.p1  ORF type:complete len:822 (-),score=103.16 TRINITY_DN17265_c1_g3_i1:114-2579(-)
MMRKHITRSHLLHQHLSFCMQPRMYPSSIMLPMRLMPFQRHLLHVMMALPLLFLCFFAPLARADVMNAGGVPYSISNPPGSTQAWKGEPGTYSTDFHENVKGPVEYFDVYGEVQTRYSQVYWTRNAPINLPPQLVDRFHGKVMAITGYEIDQVTHSGSQKGSTSTAANLGGFSCYPSCGESDKSVPSYHAYNHHYFAWLVGKDAEMFDREDAIHIPNPSRTGFRTLNDSHGFPTNIVFKENPGGEYRKSYHGYPSGYAQLIHSPTQWIVEPMQIDTHNRQYDINDQEGYKPWFLPKIQQNDMTDTTSGLSPLIECPCSNRIAKRSVSMPSILNKGTCQSPISTSEACAAEVRNLAQLSASMVVDNASMPSGCNMVPEKIGVYKAVFNTAKSLQSCGSGASKLTGKASLGGLTELTVEHDGMEAHITMSGPAGAWFGVGFHAKAMADLPYAVIIDGNGAVTERKLQDHGPGIVLNSSITVVSSTVSSEVRTVVLKRAVLGASPQHYSIPTTPGVIDMITAIGSTPDFSYHKAHGGGKITLLAADTTSCVCQPSTAHYMVYMNTTSLHFEGYNCADEPRGDMLRHGDGTGRNVSNAACSVQSYHGGLQCCKHTYFLTDIEQDSLIPNMTDTYFLKWRYYFQEYVPAKPVAPASHQHLHHWVFLIDQSVNDYEEDNAHYGHQSIGNITAHLTARDMGLEDVPASFTGITPLVITPHCHAPSCIREELWNADTGEIICNVSARYGSSENGATSNVFNEADYIAISPCIFGFQPGLQYPFTLSPSTKLKAVKYFNNTFRHLGQMAQWTGLMVYDNAGYSSQPDVII